MGYALANTCYPDTAEALAAFRAQFPYFDGGSVYFEGVAATVNASGLITFRIDKRAVNSPTVTQGTSQTTQLTACDTELLGSYPVQDILFVVAAVALWALGFKAGKMR